MKKTLAGFQRKGLGMKPLYRLFVVAVSAALGLIASTANGQIAVTITGNSNTTPNLASSYTSFANFVTALNSVTAVSGSVTATLAAGSSETAPIKGFNISTSTANVFTTTNTLTIIKAAGSATTINAGVGTSAGPTASSDGMLYLSGMDGVTIDGLTFTDGNTASSTVAMEFGIALFKRSAGDGCNGNTIQNCTFNMQRINNATAAAPMGDGSHAIIVMNSTPAANTTALTPTNGGTLASNGTNSNNKFYSNSINNGNAGIYLSGYAASSGVGPSPTATSFLGDINNDIGGSSAATGNTILNFGGGASTNAAVGIRANNQWSVNISYNTIDNNNGSGTNHATSLRGIYAQAGTSANVTINNNRVTVRSGATTSILTAIDNAIGSTAASNTVNINNNIIRLSYTTATTGLSAAITNTSTAAAVNINGNNVQGVTSANFSSTGTHILIAGGSPGGTLSISNDTISNFTMTGASGILRCITATTPTGLCTISGNLIENISYSTAGSTGSITGIYSLSSAALENFNNNIIRNFSTPGTGTLNGIQNNTVSGTYQCKNNQVYNFTTSSGGAGGFTATGISWTNANVDVSGNVVYSINSTGTSGGSGGTIVGMSVSGSASIYNNKVYSLSSASTGAVVTGIVSTGTTTNIYNNLVGNLSAPASNTANAVIGMNIAGASTTNAYYNSIYLPSLASTGAAFGASGMYMSSTTTSVNLINNLVVIKGTANGTANITALRRVSGTAGTVPSTYATTSNNNLFYAGTPSSANLIYTEGTTSFTNSMQTLAAYKTFMGNRDQSSATEDPTFQSTTGSSADFLKFSTTVATQLESGGAVISGYTTDYAGTTRNASTPDIGAWELNGVAADLTAPSISYSALPSTLCTTAPSLSATITDASGVNATAGTAPRLYYKKSTDADNYVGNTSADNGWKYVESTSGSSPFSFTLNGSLLQAPLATGDVIQYFVTAQDNATTANVGINSGTFAAAPSSVALTSAAFPIGGTVRSYSILSPISTSVTIGAAGTYPSITGAGGLFAAINAGGLSANTVATIVDASVTEDGSVALNQISYGCSGSPTLTIKPQTTATLTGSVASGALIKLNGADNVIIDGSNNGSTDKSLTIANTATTAPAGIWIASTGTGTGATNNTIKNCIINVNSSLSATSTGITVSGSTINSAGADNDNITIQNNTINSPSIGIYANGSAAVSSGGVDNLSISGNSFATGSSSVSTGTVYGIRVGNALSASVVGNTFNLTTSGATTPVGISYETGVSGSSITANQIQGVVAASTNGYGGRGITVGTGSASSNITIANNFIAGVAGSNYSSFGNSSSAGIWIGVIGNTSTLTNTTGGVNIYHNTVNMAGSYSYAAACLTAGIYIGSNASALDIRNNILVNSMNNSNGSGTTSKNYAIYSAAANTAFSSINYNDYYVSGTQGVLSFLGSDRSTLADLTTAFGGNANSVNTAPIFASATNLHIQGYTTSMPLKSAGTPIGSVTTDIDGDARNGTTPDIGADEFAVIPVVAVSSASATASSCTAISHTVSATVTPGGTAVSSVTLSYSFNGTAQTPISMTNSSGNTWTATIPAATPTNAVVAWTITAVDGITSVTSSGSYQDDLLNGYTGVATATPNSLCAGSSTSLTMKAVKNGSQSLGSGSTTVGGASSSVTGSPFGQYYEAERAQYLILAADLRARGLGAGAITAMSIPVSAKNSTKPYTGFSIKIGNTSSSSLSGIVSDATTQVYLASTTVGQGYSTVAGANDFAFGTGAGSSSSFTWDGSSNLLVDICYANDPSGAGNYYSSNDIVSANITSYTSYYMIYADNTSYCNATTGTNNNSGSKLPNFTFTGVIEASADSYSWSDGSSAVGSTSPLSQTPSSTVIFTGTFTKSGCSVTDTANVTVTPLTSTNNTVSACDRYTWSASGITYTQTGLYRQVTGCNTDTLNLTVTASTKVSSTQNVCDSYTWSVNGTTYTQSGNYTSVSGCDTSILNLTVTASTNGTTTINTCDSYVWSLNGQTYTQSGNYTNVAGCHTQYLALTIRNKSNSSFTQSGCDSYTWPANGQTYTQSGSYTYIGVNAAGCDSVMVLSLTVTPSSSSTATESTCDSYTWPVTGATYTQSGTYSKVTGCNTQYLNLTITPSTTVVIKQQACQSYTWPENGQTYTQSGNYPRVVGCQTRILKLTIRTQ